ncbi:hypothetical protein VNO77_23873 [Canavalia gladiata]|uniref:GATA-type domain-containing protein n=1 Tax=Canavalia gladiata TaxID=3824 RepID=A0AAN9L8J6_CANGL
MAPHQFVIVISEKHTQDIRSVHLPAPAFNAFWNAQGEGAILMFIFLSPCSNPRVTKEGKLPISPSDSVMKSREHLIAMAFVTKFFTYHFILFRTVCHLFSLYLLSLRILFHLCIGQKENCFSCTLALIFFSLSLCYVSAFIMIPAYRHSVSSVMPLDLNEDQNHELFSPNRHVSSSFSSLSSSYPILFNSPDQDQEGSYCWEPAKQLPSHDEEAEKIVPSSGSWDQCSVAESEHKLKVWKKEEMRNENVEAAAEDGSVKWMSSKMRMMRKMMVSDQTDAYIAAGNSKHKFEDKKQPLSPLGTDNSSNNYSNHTTNNNAVRVCADCHTTKTPLWRSGPKGPKSLCNACGIRQRKARRAMAASAAASASASANGTILVETETSVKGNKLQKKEKRSRIEMKKKRKLGTKPSQSKRKFGFEDLTLRLSKKLALHQVFPQDEKEAAILLMALSYGLVHG